MFVNEREKGFAELEIRRLLLLGAVPLEDELIIQSSVAAEFCPLVVKVEYG